MSTRNLDALFAPRSVTLVGASNRPGSVGFVVARNLSTAGFSGVINAINPHESRIADLPTYPSVEVAPPGDLAVIATPPDSVPRLVAELGDKGYRAAVVITAGLSAEARQAMLDEAKRRLLRIVGPNCLGLLSPAAGLNASFAHISPKPGGLALIAQSGAVTTAALDWATGRGFGFSHVVTLGDMADVDFGDLLDYLALDPLTKAILLYVESITGARKFMSAARAAARLKPVVVVKAGRSAAGATAAFSHTRALAGSDLVYDAVFRRAGMLRVAELREMFDAVATLTAGLKVAGDRLTILTNGGGAGVMAVDALEGAGGRLAPLGEVERLALNVVLPPTWSHGNPVDIIGDAPSIRYGQALDILEQAPDKDAILVLNCPTALASGADIAELVASRPRRSTPVLTCWLGGPAAQAPREIFGRAGIPSYETPEEAVRAFMHLADHHRNQMLLLETPPPAAEPPDRAAVRRLIDTARAAGRSVLSEPDAKATLAAYGVPVLESRFAADPESARRTAQAMTGPFALKIVSADISHKSDVGGVALNLDTPAAVAEAAEAMRIRVLKAMPDAHIDGFAVQPMVVRPMARELIVGITPDPTFGPAILFGAGGVEVEVLADRVMGLPPLNRFLALDIIDRTRVARRLAAFRDHPAARTEAVADVLVALSALALDFPEISELDINPLLADGDGVLAVDARISLGVSGTPSAIRAYPEGLSRHVQLHGVDLLIRPVRPEDEPLLIEMARQSSREDLRLRFRAGLRELPHAWAARLSQIDYDREMALVAFAEGDAAGVSRLAADPDGETAEFALFIRTDWHRRGLGRALLCAIVDYARQRGIGQLWGDVMVENQPMLALVRSLGFGLGAGADGSLVRATLAFAHPDAERSGQ